MDPENFSAGGWGGGLGGIVFFGAREGWGGEEVSEAFFRERYYVSLTQTPKPRLRSVRDGG